ncbi:MAG: NAD-dependent epimerase/dehydratase family protein [Gemmatimonadetes bacterium]|nr:NAD-dependent epimerase/dehydratase family protein [Gemmatimonadota bacterium]
MRILVTGGTGFTGAALTLRLLKEGHDVVVLDNGRGIRFDQLKAEGADIRLGDLRKQELVEECVAGCDAVFHIAAAFRAVNRPDAHYYDVNVNGTRQLCEASLAAGVSRFINCSTCGVHGDIHPVPANEDAPIRPNDYYQQTKHLAEEVLPGFHDSGLNTTTIRPLGIYGPGDPGRFLMLFRAVKRGVFPMFGDGRTLFHPVYIDNLVDSFLLALTQPPSPNGSRTYLVGDEEFLTLDELVRAVARSMGRAVRIVKLPYAPMHAFSAIVEGMCRPFRIPPPLFPRRVSWYRSDRAFTIERAKSELGYEPRISLEEGLARTARWYAENGFL